MVYKMLTPFPVFTQKHQFLPIEGASPRTCPVASSFLSQAWVPAAWEVPRAEAGPGQVSGGEDFRASFLRSVSLPRGENGKLG